MADRESKAPLPADERLARLGREWFADVRRQHPEEPERKRRDRSGTGDSDWLASSDDGDGGCDGGD